MSDSNVLLMRQLETSCPYVTVLQNGNKDGNKKTGVCRFHVFFEFCFILLFEFVSDFGIRALDLFPCGVEIELLHEAIKPAMIDLEQPCRGHLAASRLFECTDD